jgi:hypothetical protein
MAVSKIFPIQDTTLYSNQPDANTGLDSICEIFNKYELSGNPSVARYLSLYDNTEINDTIDNLISGSPYQVYLKNYISTAYGITQPVNVNILAVAQEWNNGTGYYGDLPAETNGACWTSPTISGAASWNMSGSYNSFAYTGSYVSEYGGGNWYTTSSLSTSTEQFIQRSIKDIEVDVTNIVNAWHNSDIPNHGFITKLSSSHEFISNLDLQPTLKYYSVDTNTIYPPYLEFRWNDYKTVLTASATSSIVSTTDLKLSLSENPGTFTPEDINRFYVNVSPLYPTRVFQTSSLFTSTHYLPTSSYYAVKDLDTNEFVIIFDETYTKISSDSRGNYFDLYMSGLETDRYYQILIKTTINGTTRIFDDNYYFKIVN